MFRITETANWDESDSEVSEDEKARVKKKETSSSKEKKAQEQEQLEIKRIRNELNSVFKKNFCKYKPKLKIKRMDHPLSLSYVDRHSIMKEAVDKHVPSVSIQPATPFLKSSNDLEPERIKYSMSPLSYYNTSVDLDPVKQPLYQKKAYVNYGK
mmetsp:Transcript_13187/g.13018  ORF Transcript_13187/g.13018 Transcript_13187/m.13018 type:complete len:154 (+) Transcript_13187:33-494(+)